MQSNFGMTQNIWADIKHFGTCKSVKGQGIRMYLLGFRILMSDLKCDTSLVYLGKCTLAANKV